MDPELKKSINILAKLGILVLALLAAYLLIQFLFPYLGIVFAKVPNLLLPFIIAMIIALIVEPAVALFENKLGLSRSWSVLIVLFLFLGLIFSALFFLAFKISNELIRLSPAIVSYSSDIGRIIIEGASEIRLYYLEMELPPEILQTVQNHWESGVQIINNILDSVLSACINALIKLPNIMITIVISAIATFFLVKDRAIINKFLWRILPRHSKVRIKRISNELYKSLIGFMKAYCILVAITAAVTMIALTLLGVEYAFTIGIITGIMDLLPVVGTGMIFIPWIIWELFLGSKSLGISLLVVYVIISVTRQILEPKITGDNIGLHPLATLLAMYVGLKLIGFAGVILGPVILVVVLAIKRVGYVKKRTAGSK